MLITDVIKSSDILYSSFNFSLHVPKFTFGAEEEVVSKQELFL